MLDMVHRLPHNPARSNGILPAVDSHSCYGDSSSCYVNSIGCYGENNGGCMNNIDIGYYGDNNCCCGGSISCYSDSICYCGHGGIGCYGDSIGCCGHGGIGCYGDSIGCCGNIGSYGNSTNCSDYAMVTALINIGNHQTRKARWCMTFLPNHIHPPQSLTTPQPSAYLLPPPHMWLMSYRELLLSWAMYLVMTNR